MPLPSGYLLINKPLGISSFFALRKLQFHIRDTYSTKVKLGHSGTLDPMAEGLLLCGVEKGTRVLEELLLADKGYTAEIFLGKFSDTDDEEGEKFPHKTPRINPPSKEEILEVLATFVGKISQIPPQYSAIKVSGKRSCDRIRESKNPEKKISLEARDIEIFSINLLEYSFPLLKISVHCGSGTYIRSIARDLGEHLKTGGYIYSLRRDSIGIFNLHDAKEINDITIDDIKKFSPDMFSIPIHIVDETTQNRLYKGQRVVFFPEAQREFPKEKIAIFSEEKLFLGFGERDGRLLRPKKMIEA